MKEDFIKVFEESKFNFSRMISGSKSFYRQAHPENNIVFNSRIYLLEDFENYQAEVKDFFKGMEKEIWYGDLDITLDKDDLQAIQLKIGKPIIITTEHGTARAVIDKGTLSIRN